MHPSKTTKGGAASDEMALTNIGQRCGPPSLHSAYGVLWSRAWRGGSVAL